jgi:hypothetical protein
MRRILDFFTETRFTSRVAESVQMHFKSAQFVVLLFKTG